MAIAAPTQSQVEHHGRLPGRSYECVKFSKSNHSFLHVANASSAIAAGIARLVIWIEVLNTAANPTEDVNLAVAMSLYWGMIEAGLGYTASQLPALSTYLSTATHRQIAESLRHAAGLISLRSLSVGSYSNRSANKTVDDREHYGDLNQKTTGRNFVGRSSDETEDGKER